jgi:hypothetical protein
VPLNFHTEHEQATFGAETALKGREATGGLLESPSNLQKDTQDAPDSTRSDDLQAELHGTPDAHLDGEDEGKERSDSTNRCEASPKEASRSAPKSSSLFVGIEQHDVQPLVRDEGKKGSEDDENEILDKDEQDGEGGEGQIEQVEKEQGASSAYHAEGSDDGEREALETPYVELEPTQNEERLEEGARRYGAFDGARRASDINNEHDLPSTQEVVNMHGTASPSKTSAVPVSPSDVVSTPWRGLEHGTDAEQVISNDLVANRANITKRQAEHACLTTQHEDDIEGAQSHHSDEVCNEDEIVVANGPQRGPRLNGSIVDPRTKATLGERGHTQDLVDANDSSSDVEEDSNGTSPKDNAPNHVRPRAKRAPAANSGKPETPRKRRKMSAHLIEETTCSTVNDIPESLIQPPKIYQLIAGVLSKDRKHNTMPLTSFFFAIGSPYAINSLEEACKQVHSVQASGPFLEDTGARRSTRALDRIDMYDKASPILRHYHLVQLVKRRDELQRELNGVLCQQEPKKLKYGLRRQPPPKVLVGPKGAASQTLERLMGEAYPKPLQDMEMERTVQSAVQGTEEQTLRRTQLACLASKIRHRHTGSVACGQRSWRLELRVSQPYLR